MNKARLQKIETEVKEYQDGAEGIMDGGENYDGADGARYMLVVCGYCRELIAALKEASHANDK